MNYYKKYLKYKLKYLNTKSLSGGCHKLEKQDELKQDELKQEDELKQHIDNFIQNYEDIIFNININNRDSLISDDFPTTHEIINDSIILNETMIKLIYSKVCHMVGIFFIQYLINIKKISKIPNIKIHVLKSYSYSDIIEELTDDMLQELTSTNNIRSSYIDKIIDSAKTNQTIKDELIKSLEIEKKNNMEALEFIKQNNTISRILINRDSLHEFVIININSKLYLLQTNIYNFESNKISIIELSIEDIENIFNNNINQNLFNKIYFKIPQYDGFFINAFYGYNICVS
jgi:hypothetical protein